MRQTKHPLRGLAVRQKHLEFVGSYTRRALRTVVHLHDPRRTECNVKRDEMLKLLAKAAQGIF